MLIRRSKLKYFNGIVLIRFSYPNGKNSIRVKTKLDFSRIILRVDRPTRIRSESLLVLFSCALLKSESRGALGLFWICDMITNLVRKAKKDILIVIVLTLINI